MLPGDKVVGTKDENIINEAIKYIKHEIDILDDPRPINYEVITMPTMVKFLIHDQEFILSLYFSLWLIEIQTNYLWPKNIYNVIFMYDPLPVT
jgi:hypothetical protein